MKTKMRTCIIVFLLVFSSCFYQNAHAGGFPVNKGNWLLAPMYSHYSASSYWNSLRVIKSYDNNGLFTSHYFGLYGAFGIDKNLNFVFNVPYVVQSYSATNYLAQTSTLGDATLGLSYYFPNENPYKHISVTGSLIIPLSQNIITTTTTTSIAPVGFQSLGLEAKLGFAGTNMNVMKNTYYDVEGGVRQYFATGGPAQAFFNATFGVPLDKDWKIAGTLGGVTSSSNNKGDSTINKDFGYLRFTFAVGYNISPGTSLWANVFTDVSGRNIGVGRGFSVFAVFKF